MLYYILFFPFGAARTLFCTAALSQNPLGRASWVVRGRLGGLGFLFGTSWFFVPLPLRPLVSLPPPLVASLCAARSLVLPGVGLVGGVQGTPVVWSVCFGVWLVSLPPPPVSASQGRAARLVSLNGVRSVRRIGVAVRVCGARQRTRPGRVSVNLQCC